MRKASLLTALLLYGLFSFGQTLLYYETFDSGGAPFVLGTTDVNSTAQPNAYNDWVINNSYNGGTGSYSCFAVTYNYTSINTATQPTAFVNSPTSNYMHIVHDAAVADGIANSTFLDAGYNFCQTDQNHFARMNTDINTVGYDTVSLEFWYLCGGEKGKVYGEVYYSVDGGITWSLITSPYAEYDSVFTWTKQTIQLDSFAQQSKLRIGFRFVNTNPLSKNDPGFSIDEIKFFGKQAGGGGGTASINTGAVNPLEFCAGDSIYVSYSIGGAGFQPGNVFRAELSDLTGGFSSPTMIGFVNDTAPGVVPSVIPANTFPGSQYRVRVVGTVPVTNGTDNGFDIKIVDTIPSASFTKTITGDSVTLVNQSSNGTTYSWDLGDGTTATTLSTTHTYTANGNYLVTLIATNACGSDTFVDSVLINVVGVAPTVEPQVKVYPNPNDGKFTIDFGPAISGELDVTVWNPLGQIVRSKKTSQSQCRISGLEPGIYFLGIRDSFQKKSVLVVVE